MAGVRKDSSAEIPPESLSLVLEYVRAALRELKFGHVTLVVQDGRVVQVDRFEKIRVKDSNP